MTFRTLDASAFNEIANHPEVRPWLGYVDWESSIDLSAQVGNPNNFAFLTHHHDGAYLLLKLQPGLYAAHTMATPPARGKPMLKLMREGFSMMFRASDAIEIVTQVPDGNENASAWSALAGFRDTFRREGFFPLMNELVGCQFKSLHFNDWAFKDHTCRHLGEVFHQRLRATTGHVNHLADPAHDAMVGAAIGCCMDGNAVKGVGLYNRWASVAGYAQADLISTQPVMVDTGEAIVQIETGRMEILSAREAPLLN